MRRKPNDRTQLSAVLLSIVLTVSIVGAVALAPVAADSHTKDQAPQMNEEADITISAVSQSDHYPGSQNQEGGSLQYFASGSDAFSELGAEEGLYIDYIVLDADWIDYSACTIDNTASFGLDRGGDNEGTNYDEDLVQKQKETDFRDDGITINFYNWEDFSNDPPFITPEDEIVAQQGEGSAGGPCMTMTSEPGWYRIDGFLNGTVADNGQGQQPSEDAEQVGLNTVSDWFYVCDCESEEEAREQLGPPPGEEGSGSSDGDAGGDGGDAGDAGDGGGESTPGSDADAEGDGEGSGDGTPAQDGEGTPADTGDGSGDGEPADTSEGSGDGEPADTGEGNEPGGETGSAETGNQSGEGNGSGTGDQGDAGNGSNAETGNQSGEVGGDEAPGGDAGGTPTANDGPGFGALVAIVALLGSALLLNRRW